MRRDDWEQRLAAVIADWLHKPFRWGERDCAHLALAVLVAVSMRDWTQLSLQPYRTARGAKAMLRRLGVHDMPALAHKMLGTAMPVSFARRGDLIACHDRNGPALGVCLGAHMALPGEAGLVFRPLSDAFSCWRI